MNRPFSRETEAELLRAAEAHPGQGLVLGADGVARPKAATKIVNGQEFTRVRYTNHGAHPPLETWYPTCNLESLRSVCDVEIVVTDFAPAEPDWAVLGPKLAEASTRAQYIAKLLASIADMALELDTLETGGAVAGLFDEYGAPPITAESTKAEIRRRLSMISDALADQPTRLAA